MIRRGWQERMRRAAGVVGLVALVSASGTAAAAVPAAYGTAHRVAPPVRAAAGAGDPARAQDPETLTAGPLIIHYWPGDRRLAASLLDHARSQPPLPALPAGILAAGPAVQIYLAPDPARFDSLTGGAAPEWGAGVAFPEQGRVVLPGYASQRVAPRELPGVLRHELAHIALARYLAPARPPRWFNEGYARWAAGEWDQEAAWQLRLAFALNRAPPLDSISLDWPAGQHDARIAYLLATTTVTYLVERSGERGLRHFLERWKETGQLEAAMRSTYGLTLAQFEEDWREEVKDRFGWALMLSHSLVFWLFITLLLLLVAGRRRRHDRARLERLRAGEPPDAPAYWLEEDPDDVGPPQPDDVARG